MSNSGPGPITGDDTVIVTNLTRETFEVVASALLSGVYEDREAALKALLKEAPSHWMFGNVPDSAMAYRVFMEAIAHKAANKTNPALELPPDTPASDA